ncbi:MAG: SRPBCC family protein [Actinomycetota bacterium]
MITYEGTESIARPPSEVFGFVSDIRNEPRWHTDILEARLIEGASVAKGSKFGVKFKPFMGQSEGTITIVEYDSPRRIVFRGRMGKMEPTVIHTVEPDHGGSRFTRRLELEPRGLLRLMAPLMGGMFRKQNAGFVATLKRVLEDR